MRLGSGGVLYALVPPPPRPGTSSCLLGIAWVEGLALLSGRSLGERSLSTVQEDAIVASLVHTDPSLQKHSY